MFATSKANQLNIRGRLRLGAGDGWVGGLFPSSPAAGPTIRARLPTAPGAG